MAQILPSASSATLVWFDRSVGADSHSVARVLETADRVLLEGRSAAARAWPTGFDPLDTFIGGGVRAGELTLVTGAQGLGKTMFTLQVLRNVVAAGGEALYFSYEHDAGTLLERLIALEGFEIAGVDGVTLRRVREAMEAKEGTGSLADRLAKYVGGEAAVAAVAAYGERFRIHESSGRETDLVEIRSVIEAQARSDAPVVVIDYLQKIPMPGGPEVESERVTHVVEALKDLTMSLGVPIIAITAADQEGISVGKRLRASHLRGSSALAYEADVVLVLNDKFDVVARHHLVYDTGNAERFHDWAVLSIEKNRAGIDRVDVEFRKRFEQGCYERVGREVREKLQDERVYVE